MRSIGILATVYGSVFVLLGSTCFATDCNENALEDALDISGGTSIDCDANGVPDECDLGQLFPFGLRAPGPRSFLRHDAHLEDPRLAGDFDGDGDLDLLGLTTDPEVEYAVYLNQGNGSFAEDPSTRRVSPGLVLAQAADFDGDGDLDLLGVQRRETPLDPEYDVVLLLNTGDATFGDGVTVHPVVEPTGTATNVDAADLDGDSDLDLAISGSPSIVVLLNEGDGSFSSPLGLPPAAQALETRALADLDGDGDADLLMQTVLSTGSRTYGISNLGNGEFGSPTRLTPDFTASIEDVADLDGDGDADLIDASDGFVHLNDGAGHFVKGQSALFLHSAGDLNGDGNVDLVGFRDNPRVSLGRGDGAFEEPVTFLRLSSDHHAFFGVAADFDGDGSIDLVNGVGDVYRNDSRPFPVNDLNGNGLLDRCGEAQFFRGDFDGQGTLNITDALRALNFLFSAGPGPRCADAADANNDGGIDLSDPIFTLNFLYVGGRAPPPPGPPSYPQISAGACGPDPEGGDLGCVFYDGC
jgi:hypothetical protein